MGENQSKSKSQTGAITASILAVCLVVYLAFPVVVYIPLFALYHGQFISRKNSRPCEVLLRPAAMLGENFEWYGNLVGKEFDFLMGKFHIIACHFEP